MSAKQLTIKQRLFVEAYATCYNVAEALKVAGYASFHSTGSKLLAKPHIQTAIKQRQKYLQEVFHIEREQLAMMLLESHALAHRVSDQIKAIRQIGLMLGLYADPK